MEVFTAYGKKDKVKRRCKGYQRFITGTDRLFRKYRR